jgi:hypothetical protein
VAGDNASRAPGILAEVGEDDGDVYVLGLRVSAEDPGAWSMMFMECYDAEDEQEISLGMDTYCLVVDPGQATAYGGVLECDLSGRRLRLVLLPETAKALGMPAELIFTLAMEDQQIQLVRQGLIRVLTSGRPDALPARLNL